MIQWFTVYYYYIQYIPAVHLSVIKYAFVLDVLVVFIHVLLVKYFEPSINLHFY